MDVQPKDILIMKKAHPCGGNKMYVIRSGMDFKVPRNKIEKNIRRVIRNEADKQEI